MQSLLLEEALRLLLWLESVLHDKSRVYALGAGNRKLPRIRLFARVFINKAFARGILA